MANPIDGSNSNRLKQIPNQEAAPDAKDNVLGKRVRNVSVEKELPEVENPKGVVEKRAKVLALESERDKLVKEFYFEGFDTDGTLSEVDYDRFIAVDDNTIIGQALAILHGSIQHHGHSNDPDDPTSTISLLSEAIDKCLESGVVEWSDDIDIHQENNNVELTSVTMTVAKTIVQCVIENHSNSPEILNSRMNKIITEGLDELLSTYINLHFDHGLIRRGRNLI